MTPYAIYVLGPIEGFPSKVGIAADVKKRLCTIQISCWEKLYIHEIFWAASKSDALKCELLCKRRLKDRHLNGEWFNVFADDMIKELDEIVKAARKRDSFDTGLLIRKENYAGNVTYEYDILS